MDADQIYTGPDGTALRFFERPVKNNFQSEKNGRPIFDNALMVEVMVPGSRESTPEFEIERTYCVEASPDPANRLVERSPKYVQYQQQVEAYKAQNGVGLVSGTPISQWAQIDAGTAATLKAQGIHTVEMLAGVQDTHLNNLGMGGRVLRDQAQAYINTRQFGVPSAQMAAETANLRDDNMRLTGQVNDLSTRLNAALAENAALKQGQPAPPQMPGGPANVTLDPLSSTTTSQPDPFATLNSASASPLTPNEGEANEVAGQHAENTQHQQVRHDLAAPHQPGNNGAPPPLI